jgi:hypothetical protein
MIFHDPIFMCIKNAFLSGYRRKLKDSTVNVTILIVLETTSYCVPTTGDVIVENASAILDGPGMPVNALQIS